MNETTSLIIFIIAISGVFGFTMYRTYSDLPWFTMIPTFLLLLAGTWWLYYMIFHEKGEYGFMVFLVAMLLMMVMMNGV